MLAVHSPREMERSHKTATKTCSCIPIFNSSVELENTTNRILKALTLRFFFPSRCSAFTSISCKTDWPYRSPVSPSLWAGLARSIHYSSAEQGNQNPLHFGSVMSQFLIWILVWVILFCPFSGKKTLKGHFLSLHDFQLILLFAYFYFIFNYLFIFGWNLAIKKVRAF